MLLNFLYHIFCVVDKSEKCTFMLKRHGAVKVHRKSVSQKRFCVIALEILSSILLNF